MVDEKEVILTHDGLLRLEEELEYLKTHKRREVADRIKQAIEFGDISENSEYEDAKNEQAFIEGRIIDLEKKLRNVRVIEESERAANEVSLGSTVVIREVGDDLDLQYTIVGSVEADPASNRISNESPVGMAVLGKSKGSIVEVAVPVGVLRYEIVDVR